MSASSATVGSLKTLAPALQDYDSYWREPKDFAAKGLTPAYWNDPWPELQGMLTSEHIKAYDDAVGGMIREFDPARLKTASYELTLGRRYLKEGKEGILTGENQRLTLPQNSLTFVSMEQVLCLPHYLVGRFDLAIDFIYQGLLLGTGPQVDPGFQGGLSCPLHNISNEPITIKLGESFAKIDFAKTVPRPPDVQEAWRGLKTEKELRRWIEDQPPNSSSRVFKDGAPKWREPIYGYLGKKRPTSSVQQLQRRLDRYLRGGLWAAGIGVVALLVGIPALILQGSDLATHGFADESAVTKVQEDSETATQSLEEQVRELRREVRRLRNATGD